MSKRVDVSNRITTLFNNAVRLSQTVIDAKEAASKAHDLQKNDEAEAIGAWNDLYEQLVDITTTDAMANQSKLGIAIQRSV